MISARSADDGGRFSHRYASGILDTPDEHGRYLPIGGEHSTQWMQGVGPMANHDSVNYNATIAFLPLANSEAARLLPRIPTLKAHRRIEVCATGLNLRIHLRSPISEPISGPTSELISEWGTAGGRGDPLQLRLYTSVRLFQRSQA